MPDISGLHCRSCRNNNRDSFGELVCFAYTCWSLPGMMMGERARTGAELGRCRHGCRREAVRQISRNYLVLCCLNERLGSMTTTVLLGDTFIPTWKRRGRRGKASRFSSPRVRHSTAYLPSYWHRHHSYLQEATQQSRQRCIDLQPPQGILSSASIAVVASLSHAPPRKDSVDSKAVQRSRGTDGGWDNFAITVVAPL